VAVEKGDAAAEVMMKIYELNILLVRVRSPVSYGSGVYCIFELI